MLEPSGVYLIKDLSRLSGHSIHTLKFYLKLGLIREVGRSRETRFRYFDDSTLQALSRIREWRKAGEKLANIQLKLCGPQRSGPPEAALTMEEAR